MLSIVFCVMVCFVEIIFTTSNPPFHHYTLRPISLRRMHSFGYSGCSGTTFERDCWSLHVPFVGAPVSPTALHPLSHFVMKKRGAAADVPPCRRVKRLMPAAVASALRCSTCGDECDDACSNWPAQPEADDHGDPVPLGPQCCPCISFQDNLGQTEKQLLKGLDTDARGNKKAALHLREDLDQHKDSLQNMQARDFPMQEVWKESWGGVEMSDGTSVLVGTDTWKSRTSKSMEECKIDRCSRDIPGCRSSEGVVVTKIPLGAGSSGEDSLCVGVGDEARLLRKSGTRFVLRECLLDGKKAATLSLSLYI
jgi:hypothetical protein